MNIHKFPPPETPQDSEDSKKPGSFKSATVALFFATPLAIRGELASRMNHPGKKTSDGYRASVAAKNLKLIRAELPLSAPHAVLGVSLSMPLRCGKHSASHRKTTNVQSI